MAYLMDTGNPYSGHISFGHKVQSYMEKVCNSSFTGALTSENDEMNTALQAADVISWSARRRVAEGLTEEFAPLDKLFEKRFRRDGLAVSPHYTYTPTEKILAKLRDGIESRGPSLPTLQEWVGLGQRCTVRQVE